MKKVTSRELDVLSVLCGSEKNLTASEIVEKNSNLSINTVHTVLREMLRSGHVEVAAIVQSGNVLGRSYVATAKARELITQHFITQHKAIARSVPPDMLFSAMLENVNDTETIKALEAVIKRKKDELPGE